jgi:hypothetical protein
MPPAWNCRTGPVPRVEPRHAWTCDMLAGRQGRGRGAVFHMVEKFSVAGVARGRAGANNAGATLGRLPW